MGRLVVDRIEGDVVVVVPGRDARPGDRALQAEIPLAWLPRAREGDEVILQTLGARRRDAES